MGLLDPLYWVVSWILREAHAFWSLFLDPASGAAWGLSIVVLVVIMRIILIPLFVKQIKTQRNMQALQPQLQELQKRYKDDKQKQSEEMMKLYKETGTNPLSGCFPILLQAPFFFALFHVLQYVVAGNRPLYALDDPTLVEQAREATIFSAPIASTFLMSAQDVLALGGDPTATKIVSVVMIILMSASTFLTQRQIMLKNVSKTINNPFMQQQKILLYVFPLIFAVSGVNFPIGVLLYWLTTNLWTMGQQFYVIRNNPTPGSPAYAAWEARQKEKQARKRAKRGELPEPPPEAPATPPRVQPKRQSRRERSGSGQARQGGQQQDAQEPNAQEQAARAGNSTAAEVAKAAGPDPTQQSDDGQVAQQPAGQPGRQPGKQPAKRATNPPKQAGKQARKQGARQQGAKQQAKQQQGKQQSGKQSNRTAKQQPRKPV